MTGLQSTDREFVLEFDKCVSAVLRSRRHTLWHDSKRKEIHVEARSVLLYNFLRQSLDSLRPWIQHCNNCVAAFLRGFFDSEGSVGQDGELTTANNDLVLLDYVRKLLMDCFGIESTGPHLGKKAGTKIERRGRSYYRNSDSFRIYIRRGSLKKFATSIGLTIMRKRERLQGTVNRAKETRRG